MKGYTVIGIYKDNSEVFTDHFEAADPSQAMQLAAEDKEGADVLIIGAIESENELNLTPAAFEMLTPKAMHISGFTCQFKKG